tara:strand:+ start:2076 stop:3479 length:1404 start_codon:yes stop_codon:yes gene_type:complete
MFTLIVPAPEGMPAPAWHVVGVGLLMACWWATEALPVPITSLLPMVLFPLIGITSMKAATTPYAQPVIYLLFGGFVIATALERWNLHRRLALYVLNLVGDHPAAIIAGFMGATAFLSMWISNTASTIMMIPIALSLAHVILRPQREKGHAFSLCLVLGIAYAASIGGLGTLIGTPPNALVAGFMASEYNIQIGFVQWMAFGLPVVIVMVPLAWFILTRWVFHFQLDHNPQAHDVIRTELTNMGRWTRPERRTAYAFITIALLWITRPLLQKYLGLPGLNDALIAVGGAISLFLIPAGNHKDNPSEKSQSLLDWESASRIPWGVLLLFGGGMSLAAAVNSSGLALWLGEQLAGLTTLHMLLLLFALVSLVIFLTELTSNTATTAALLPVLGAIAAPAAFDPMMLAAPAALAASCAFMLPVATAPNAIIYASGEVTIAQMARAGFWLNIVGIFIVSTLSYFLVPIIFLP